MVQSSSFSVSWSTSVCRLVGRSNKVLLTSPIENRSVSEMSFQRALNGFITLHSRLLSSLYVLLMMSLDRKDKVFLYSICFLNSFWLSTLFFESTSSVYEVCSIGYRRPPQSHWMNSIDILIRDLLFYLNIFVGKCEGWLGRIGVALHAQSGGHYWCSPNENEGVAFGLSSCVVSLWQKKRIQRTALDEST